MTRVPGEVLPAAMRHELTEPVLEDVDMSSTGTRQPSALQPTSTAAVSCGMQVAAHVCILISVLLPVFALILCFSVMGFGDVVYVSLNAWEWPWYVAALLDGVLALLLWLFDATSWRRPALVFLRRTSIVLFVTLAGIACLLATKLYPLAPLLFGLLLIPASVFFSRHAMLRALEPSAYLGSLSISLGITGLLLVLYFFLWVFVLPPPPRRLETGWDPSWSNTWRSVVKEYWRRRLGCHPTDDDDCYDAAFLWWFFPLVIAMALVFSSAACSFLSRTLAKEGDSGAEAGAIRLFLVVVALVAVGLYFAASIAGAGMGLGDLVVDGVLFLLASAIVMVGITLGWERFMHAISEQPWVRRARAYLEVMNEWCIALALCVGMLPILAYLLASWLKQQTRKARRARRLQASGRAGDSSGGGPLTAEATAWLRQLSSLPWGSLCAKASLVNLAYLTLSIIVAKAVVVFLSALTFGLSHVPVVSVLLIFLVVGITMFLIPVIPGVPVYICAGVLIPSALMTEAERADTSSAAAPTSFWLGLLLACIIGALLKFVAIVLQQEVIGKKLGRHITVRATVQINSTFIRAARLVLTQPGCTFGKTMILCGGPDWPTSVLTGILNLPVGKMLVGSLPVVIIIVPCCVLGASLSMGKRPGWETASEFVTLVAGASQLLASIGFAAVIERATVTHAEAIAALPYDEEVRALDAQRTEYVRAWREAADWGREGHPKLARCTLAAAALLSGVGCHLAVLLRCFERVTVADPFNGPLLQGNPLNVVHGVQGWTVIVCFAASSLLLFAHHRWLAAEARRMPAASHTTVGVMVAAEENAESRTASGDPSARL